MDAPPDIPIPASLLTFPMTRTNAASSQVFRRHRIRLHALEVQGPQVVEPRAMEPWESNYPHPIYRLAFCLRREGYDIPKEETDDLEGREDDSEGLTFASWVNGEACVSLVTSDTLLGVEEVDVRER